MRRLGWKARDNRHLRLDSGDWFDFVSVFVIVFIVRALVDNHNARPAMVVNLFALAGGNRYFEDADGFILKYHAMIGRRGADRILLHRLCRIVSTKTRVEKSVNIINLRELSTKPSQRL